MGSRPSRCATSRTRSVCASRRCTSTSARSSICTTRCSPTGTGSSSTTCRHDYPSDPRDALVQFVAECVRFSGDDVVRHQLLLQRTIPGFEPSPESFAVALEFYEFGLDLMGRAGVHDQADVDVFTAITTGLAHQQVANDPGGDRWVRLAGGVVEMFLNDIERRDADFEPGPAHQEPAEKRRRPDLGALRPSERLWPPAGFGVPTRSSPRLSTINRGGTKWLR